MPEDGASRWLPAGQHTDQRLWLAGATQAALGAALFALRHHSNAEAAHSVAAAAFDDLRHTMAAVLQMAPTQAALQGEGPLTDIWCGCVAVELPLAGHPLRMMLNAACVAQLAPAVRAPGETGAPGLVALEVAMSGQIVTLKVELGACELDIGTLQSLRIGDVLPLAHALDAPARVFAAGNQHVCDAYLGKQGSRRAAELTRSKS
jgi:hypothetical protein